MESKTECPPGLKIDEPGKTVSSRLMRGLRVSAFVGDDEALVNLDINWQKDSYVQPVSIIFWHFTEDMRVQPTFSLAPLSLSFSGYSAVGLDWTVVTCYSNLEPADLPSAPFLSPTQHTSF
jgi:hypothetical protein